MPDVISLPALGPASFDDEAETQGSNGKPALASIYKNYATVLNAIQYAGRNLWTFWGGGANNNAADIQRGLWNHRHVAGKHLRGKLLFYQANLPRDVTQALIGREYGATLAYPVDYDALAVAASEPTGLRATSIFGDQDGVDATTNNAELLGWGSQSTNGPFITSGLMYEAAQGVIDPAAAYAYVPPSFADPGTDIIATALAADPTMTIDRLRSQLVACWLKMRPSLVWSRNLPGTGTNYVEFSAATPPYGSPTQYRYIFDQTIGTGGTAPSLTGPGMTFPLHHAASGLNTQVKLRAWVYARMGSAVGPDTGEIAFANRDASGTMTAFTAPTNPVTISGTTFQWWPVLTTGDMSFSGYAGAAYDRILLGARSSGASDKVQIAAFAIFVAP
jgi:hypothetical protein